MINPFTSLEQFTELSLHSDQLKNDFLGNINKIDRLTLGLETQSQISELLSSVHELDKHHTFFDTVTDKLIKQLNSFREFEDANQKLTIWNEAIEIQKNHLKAEYLKKSIYGLNINTKIFKDLTSITGYDRIEQQLSILNQGNIYLGEYSIEDDGDDKHDEEPPHIILPEGIQERMERVGFLPIKIFDKIRKDPQFMHGLSPRDFEYFIAELYEKMGLDVVITPRSNDKGRDIIATKTVGDTPIIIAIECKKYSPNRPIKPEIMRALLGTVSQANTKANKGVLVTTSSFSKGSKSLIASEAMLDGKDFKDIVTWLSTIKTRN